MEFRIDPWSSEIIREYDKLFKFFGIKPFKDVLKSLSRFAEPHMLMRRGIVFGHRDFEEVIKALEDRERFAILTGLMPSGRMHLGHKMVIDQVIYYQKLGAEIFITIADAEAYAVRKLGRSELIKTAVDDYVANYLALGLSDRNLHIYFQTNYSREYYRLIQMFSRKVTMAEFRALYGEDVDPGKIMAVLTQAADILHPQLKHFGGFKVVLVPVGADQDPHLRLSRDIADRFSNELGLRRPASTYHRFMTGLDGGKMSSSRPESYIALTDDSEEAGEKIMRSLTGGQATAEEQKKMGGRPERCPVYEVNAYHLVSDDRELENMYWDCRTGKILCGECKAKTREKLIRFLVSHQAKLKSARELAHKIVEVPDF